MHWYGSGARQWPPGPHPAARWRFDVRWNSCYHHNMTVSSRRVVAGLIRFGLVLLAIIFVSGYFLHKRPTRSKHTMRVETEVPPPSALAPGDMRIYNRD